MHMVSRILGGAVVASAMLVARVARAEVIDSSAIGFTVENRQVVPVDAATAWHALVEEVDRWWPKDHSWWGSESTLSISPRAGGCFCESAGEREAVHMTVVFVEPEKTLRLLGGLGPLQGMGLHGAMEFRLAPAEGGGTSITLHYRVGGYSPDELGGFAPVVDRVQGVQLKGLADYLRQAAAPQR